MEVSVQLHTPAVLPLGKDALNRKLGGSQSRSGLCTERFFALPGIEPYVRCRLDRVRYPGSSKTRVSFITNYSELH